MSVGMKDLLPIPPPFQHVPTSFPSFVLRSLKLGRETDFDICCNMRGGTLAL